MPFLCTSTYRTGVTVTVHSWYPIARYLFLCAANSIFALLHLMLMLVMVTVIYSDYFVICTHYIGSCNPMIAKVEYLYKLGSRMMKNFFHSVHFATHGSFNFRLLFKKLDYSKDDVIQPLSTRIQYAPIKRSRFRTVFFTVSTEIKHQYYGRFCIM